MGNKVPISAARILEAKKALEANDGWSAEIILRDLREGLERFERNMDRKPRSTGNVKGNVIQSSE